MVSHDAVVPPTESSALRNRELPVVNLFGLLWSLSIPLACGGRYQCSWPAVVVINVFGLLWSLSMLLACCGRYQCIWPAVVIVNAFGLLWPLSIPSACRGLYQFILSCSGRDQYIWPALFVIPCREVMASYPILVRPCCEMVSPSVLHGVPVSLPLY